MLKILLVQKVVSALYDTAKFFGIIVGEEIPDRFYRYPLVNGTEIEGTCIQIYPVMEIKGVESWAIDNNAEEVEIQDVSDDFHQHLPKNVRWFVDLKVQETTEKPSKKRLLQP